MCLWCTGVLVFGVVCQSCIVNDILLLWEGDCVLQHHSSVCGVCVCVCMLVNTSH